MPREERTSTTPGSSPSAFVPGIPQGGKYLTFKLGAETFGLEILRVQEIIGMMNITRVPKTPDFVRGVINLRGKIIPVIDLRRTFLLAPKTDTERTCIIVVNINHQNQVLIMGIIVDEVSEVAHIEAQAIEAAPAFGAQIDTSFILGVGKTGDNVLMLLDIDKVLSPRDVKIVDQVAGIEN